MAARRGPASARNERKPERERGRKAVLPTRFGPFWQAAGAAALLVVALGAARVSGQDCLACHGNKEKLQAAITKPGKPIERLFVDAAMLKRSVHKAKDCTECHLGFETHPHTQDAETASCDTCHEKSAESMAASIHGKAKDGSSKLPVACTSCHGVHDVLLAKERDSRLNPLNVYQVCGKCHFGHDPAQATLDDLMREEYADDAHARGILRAGLVVSASCVSCHGGHAIRAKGDPESLVARHRLDETCGKCHVRIVEDYHGSVHHARSNGVEHKGAICSDCHEPHGITEPNAEFLVDSVAACTRCHDERAGTFRQTYHGKVSSLGYGGKVATCEHCHGSHTILPADDPKSMIHPANLVKTCGSCHEGSHEGFVSYMVHADPRDGKKNPGLHVVYLVMMGLIGVVVTFGAVHVLLWLVRSLAAKEWRHVPKPHPGERILRHWRPFYVVINVSATSTILALAATGVPLYFAEQPWAQSVMRSLGGPASTAFIHRLAAILLVIAFGALIANVLYRWLVLKEQGLFAGPTTMLPRKKDLQDVAGNFRWFFGRGPKPSFDRWTYWEKFDFWAVFWGMGIMGVTGWILWFPEAASRFMPGWMINVAGTIHGLEAMLAVAFHFAVQSFQSHLRPDKFPLDAGLFTGLVSEEELRHERPLEYERLHAAGQIEALAVAPPSRTVRTLARVFGLTAQAIGILILVGILWALLGTHA